MHAFNYRRRTSSVVNIGSTPMGGDYPIRVQSMANVSTMDTEKAVDQAIRMIEHGAEYVRFTAQGEIEARNLKAIREQLSSLGYNTPLVADIHFNPKAADVAATTVEKVRINPGNYVDKAKTFDRIDYTDSEYAEELRKIRDRFIPFINLCKQHHTAIRIGVNHGSLSDRIMSRYGDTIEGMVASCMEFLRICKEEKFDDVVISMKASNTVVMVQAVRLLVKTMDEEGMFYPLHLGVTEAGEGEDGRIKSAVGIGTLLQDGIGDTIRVSLSEEPEKELPVARKLIDYITSRSVAGYIPWSQRLGGDFFGCEIRKTSRTGNIGGGAVPIVVSNRKQGIFESVPDFKPDYLYVGSQDPDTLPDTSPFIIDADCWKKRDNLYPLYNIDDIAGIEKNSASVKFLMVDTERPITEEQKELLKREHSIVLLLKTSHANPLGAVRAFIYQLLLAGCDTPVVQVLSYSDRDKESLQLKAAVDFGALLLDELIDLSASSNLQQSFSKTSCPLKYETALIASCGLMLNIGLVSACLKKHFIQTYLEDSILYLRLY